MPLENTIMSESPPPQTADNAVRAFILLFALGFVLRGIDLMDESMSAAIQKWLIAAALSVIDYFYIPVRTKLGRRFATTAANVATDFRWWTVALLSALVLPTIMPFVERGYWPHPQEAQGNGPQIAPIAPSLRLQFNASGAMPEELDKQNIEWRAVNPIEKRQKGAADRYMCERPLLTFGAPSMSGPTGEHCTTIQFPEYENVITWIIILTFLKSVDVKEIKVDTHGALTPRVDITRLNQGAYLYFHGDLTRMVMDIGITQ